MNTLLQDIRYGLRTLSQSPTFTLLTVLTLALAIGVNTAIFSLVNLLMLRPLPIEDSDTMGFIFADNPQRGFENAYVSPGDFLDYREQLTSFAELAGVNRGADFVITGIDEPVRVLGFEATANTFDLWGVEPAVGRSFQAGEDRIGAERVVVLSHGTWERRFGADPEVVGRVVEIDGRDTTIIGVLPPEIEWGSLSNAEIWMPLYLERETASRATHNIWTMGRLAAGTTVEQAHQEVAAVAAGLMELYPDTNSSWVYKVVPMKQAIASDNIWTIFYMLMLTVAFVMLIACSNIATMMLARASARTKEIAVRSALGAGRGRILSQLLTESLLLSVAAGLVGLLVTRYFLAGLVWMSGENSGTNVFELLTIDRNVLLFTGAVALLAPLLFGFLPALRAARADLGETLNDASRGSSDAAGLKGRRVLVATQVSLALALMVVAGLLIRSMVSQRTFQLGFETGGILTMRVDLPDGKYPDEHRWLPFFDAVKERIDALPNIEVAGWIGSRPFADFGGSDSFLIEGAPIPEPERIPFAAVNVATRGALDALRLPVVRGRGFEPTDTAGTVPIALVNEDMVERYWNGDSPLGQRIRLGGADSTRPWLQIVGVVGNTFSGDPDDPSFPALFLPLHQNPRQGMGLVARPSGEPLAAVPALREQIRAVDPDQPLGDIRTLSQIYSDAFATLNTIISIFVVFAVFALVMASMGIYGVISFSVSRRTREIGIRMALGARGNDVIRMIARQAMWLVAIGLVIGAAGAVALNLVMVGTVPGLSGTDPVAIAGVALVLTVAALVATLVPARRATRVDPVVALRQE